MATLPSPTSERAPAEQDATPHVVAAILHVDGSSMIETLEAVGRQVYAVSGSIIVGGGPGPSPVEGVERVADLAELIDGLPGDVDLVWLLHEDAEPRPDALRALVKEMVRNDASLVGSKVLMAEDPARLESVGSATDVFGEPYSGLDPGEVDLEQYDVVRDVSFVSAVSTLIRRDLLRGLGGLDRLLPPVAAGVDLSQRARIAGGRVMVAPSAEVLHARRCRHDVAGWRELAGRMRATLKAYRVVTLTWVVPLAFAVGLVDVVARLLLGNVRPLADYVRAVGWNIGHLPSTVSARLALARVRHSGDEELFRYQVSGSVRVRELGTAIVDRFGWIIDDEPGVVTEEEMESETSVVGPAVAVVTFFFLFVATRGLWLSGAPVVGFSLPPAEDFGSVLASYAGGWNNSELGSSEALHPAPAWYAMFQALLFGWSGAPRLVTAASIVAGAVGVGRLMRQLGLTGGTRHLAGLVLYLGPFSLPMARAGNLPGLLALGALPWMVGTVVSPWPIGLRRRIGRVSTLFLSAGLVSMLAPLGTLVGLVAALVGMLLIRGIGWGVILRAAVAVAGGFLVVLPYLLGTPLDVVFGGGPVYPVTPDLVLVGILGVAVLAVGLLATEPRWMVATWGGALLALALVFGRLDGVGREVLTAAGLMGSLGSAAVVAAAIPIDTERSRRVMSIEVVGLLAALVVLGSAVVTIPRGTAGLPEDRWGDTLEFVSRLAPETGPDRVLIAGAPGSMPGEYRLGNGYAYRLIWGAVPTLDQGWLPRPGPSDAALTEALSQIDQGDVYRPGALLAEFAIRWVVVLDGAPVGDLFAAQGDMVELPLAPGILVFENRAARPRVETQVSGWSSGRVEATGPSSEARVRLADSAHPDWQPNWEQDGWANDLSATEGRVSFRPDPLRRLAAWFALAGTVAAVIGAAWGRRRS